VTRLPRHPGRPSGLTLLELLLAVSITSLVGLAMATVMTAAARGMTSAGDTRSALQRAHAAYSRLRTYTDTGLCLLQNDPARGFVLWLNDERLNGKVNLSELRVFWFSPQTGLLTVERVVFPEAWDAAKKEAADVKVNPAADLFAIMTDQRALGYTQTETVADGAIAFAIEAPTPAPADATRFRASLTTDAGHDGQAPVLMAFGLSNHQKPQ
jgi:type II secretory pathway pseudopilin PulG